MSDDFTIQGGVGTPDPVDAEMHQGIGFPKRAITKPGNTRKDYGALTNAQILAILTPDSLSGVFSTDDKINYTYYDGSWYSTGGGVLV